MGVLHFWSVILPQNMRKCNDILVIFFPIIFWFFLYLFFTKEVWNLMILSFQFSLSKFMLLHILVLNSFLSTNISNFKKKKCFSCFSIYFCWKIFREGKRNTYFEILTKIEKFMDSSFSVGIFTINPNNWLTQWVARMYLNKKSGPKRKTTATWIKIPNIKSQ